MRGRQKGGGGVRAPFATSREELAAGEYRARVVSIDDVAVRESWEHGIGYRDAAHVAEQVGLEALAFEESLAVVEVEAATGPTRRFQVAMKIKVSGIVKELLADAGEEPIERERTCHVRL